MRISQSDVQLQAQSQSFQKTSITESLRTWRDQGVNTQEVIPNNGAFLDISDAGAEIAKASVNEISETEDSLFELSDKDKAKIRLIQDFVYSLTGKRVKFVMPEKINKANVMKLQQQEAAHGEGPRRLGWGIDYQRHEVRIEKEAMSFSSSGSVTTEDGRQIQFQTNLSMSREFVQETHISFKAGDAMVDPLMLNLNNTAQLLGGKSISFDLDADGSKENIAFAAPGAGFLALDINENGQIDDGTELFGTQSGNGFADLALHDSDGNNWIDENDPIFDKLRIWSMNDAGDLELTAIGKAGVGAIYLGSVASPFSLKTADNQDLGRIARSGVYLMESGEAKTIQHVDIAI